MPRKGPSETPAAPTTRCLVSGDDSPSHQPAVTKTDKQLKIGRFVPGEIRVVAEENKALQSVGLEEHFARYPFSFDRERVDKSVDGSDDGPVNHIVVSSLFSVVSDGFGKQSELGDGVLAPIRGKRRLEISVMGRRDSEKDRLARQNELSLKAVWRSRGDLA